MGVKVVVCGDGGGKAGWGEAGECRGSVRLSGVRATPSSRPSSVCWHTHL